MVHLFHLFQCVQIDILSSLHPVIFAIIFLYELPVLLGDSICTFDGIIYTGSVMESSFRFKNTSDNARN